MNLAGTFPLFWRVCLINGTVYLLAVLVLVLSPVTVHAPPRWSEVGLLLVGLGVAIVLNTALLRSALRPLDRVTAEIATIDLIQTGRRLDEQGTGMAHILVRGFNAMLERLENERNASTSRALEAQEAERQRIAQELHDEVGQSLTSVLLGIKHVRTLASHDATTELETVRETIRSSLVEVRRICERLRPGVLAELGMLESLSGLASTLASTTGISVERHLPPRLSALDSETELVIYRVAQEAMTNVIRHAHATHVEIGLVEGDRTLRLRVADDGVGGMIEGASGTGIQGMRERARMVGGRLALRQRRGGGTEVLLEIPKAGTSL